MKRHYRRALKTKVAHRICALMAKGDLSVAETALRASEHLPPGQGISAQSLSHYRHGRALPRARQLQAIALALGVDPAEFMDDPTDTAAPLRQTVRANDVSGNARLTLNVEVPWAVALTVLQLLKAHEAAFETPLQEMGNLEAD